MLRGMIPGETFEEVHKEFLSVLNGVKATDADLEFDVEVINCREGYVVSPEDSWVKEGRDIIAEVTGRVLPFTGTLASTDMNYQVNPPKRYNIDEIGAISGGMGIPCFNLGVGGPYSNGHKQNENCSIDELIISAKIAALLYMRKLKINL